MGTNRGKQFEEVIKKSFLKLKNVSVDRIHDQTNGYAGSSNICDFIVYKYPYQYYIECKSVHGNTFPLSNLTDKQYKGLLNKSKIYGVCAGVIIWFIDRDSTMFVPIKTILEYKQENKKSIRFDDDNKLIIKLKGKKKRVFYDYEMNSLFNVVERSNK